MLADDVLDCEDVVPDPEEVTVSLASVVQAATDIAAKATMKSSRARISATDERGLKQMLREDHGALFGRGFIVQEREPRHLGIE